LVPKGKLVDRLFRLPFAIRQLHRYESAGIAAPRNSAVRVNLSVCHLNSSRQRRYAKPKLCQDGRVKSRGRSYASSHLDCFAGKKILYDPANMHVTNVPEANQYLQREYRTGW